MPSILPHGGSRAGELRTRGAVEAAQDSSNGLTAEDAEHVMGEESQRAGIAAFHFDPNASPATKAAQARAVGRRGRASWTVQALQGGLVIDSRVSRALYDYVEGIVQVAVEF